MTSYQKLKQRIAYLDQRGDELELLVHDLCKQLNKANVTPSFLLGGFGLDNDKFITDVNSGDFTLKLMFDYTLPEVGK